MHKILHNFKEIPTLFEINIDSSLIAYVSYENIINDLLKLYSLALVYYILGTHDKSIYLFDMSNVLLLSIGILAYHLVFSRIVSFNFSKKRH
jgi:hypothetical protein